MRGHSAPCAGRANAIGYVGERLKAFGTAFIICLRCAIRYLDFMGKKKKRGRPRIRTAEYWREYYTRKQREWRAAHPRIRTRQTLKQRRANDRRAASR